MQNLILHDKMPSQVKLSTNAEAFSIDPLLRLRQSHRPEFDRKIETVVRKGSPIIAQRSENNVCDEKVTDFSFMRACLHFA